MTGRALRRWIAGAGGAALAAQLAGYTVLARLDPAGVSRRTWEAPVDRGRLRIVYPGNWTLESSGDGPVFRVSMRGPAGVWMEVTGSRALKALSERPAVDGERRMDPLQRAHRALESECRRGLARYSGGASLGSGALGRESLLSFYSAVRDGRPVRGFRHTCIGEERVWSVRGECPAGIWARTAPVLDGLVRRMELP